MDASVPKHQPPFTLNNKILSQVAEISEAVGRLSVVFEQEQSLKLRRINRMRSIQGSLAIEGNTLSDEQITAILDGKRVIASPKELKEASNVIAVYDQLDEWQPQKEKHIFAATQKTTQITTQNQQAILKLLSCTFKPSRITAVE